MAEAGIAAPQAPPAQAAPPAALGPARPFPGLRPYGWADHAWFFGREQQVLALYRLLDRNRFVAVVGGSGSGKSSLVAAGLLPALAEERHRLDEPRWTLLQMRPGDAPIERLADALACPPPEPPPPPGPAAGPAPLDPAPASQRARRDRCAATLRQSSFGLAEAVRALPATRAEGHAVLLVVDQFEELFRYADAGGLDAGHRADRRDGAAAFVQLLLEGARTPGLDLRVMLTMRSDFLGDCARFPGLPEAVAASQFLVPELTRDQREQVIRRPLAKAGAGIEDALVQRLLNEAATEPDPLPVLQHALMRLWQRALRRAGPPAYRCLLTLEDHKAIGGLAGALSGHAEEILQEPDIAAVAPVVKRCFQALTELDRTGRALRRPLRFGQLLAETAAREEELRRVVDRFRRPDTSFLLPPLPQPLDEGSVVDIGHEALTRRWVRLNALAAEPLGAGAPARRTGAGWLWEEFQDGERYRFMLELAASAPPGSVATLPPGQLEQRLAQWRARPRSAAWAARYGGNLEAVERMLAASLAARQRRWIILGVAFAGILAVAVAIIWLVLGALAQSEEVRLTNARHEAERAQFQTNQQRLFGVEQQRREAEQRATALALQLSQAEEEAVRLRARLAAALETATAARPPDAAAPAADPASRPRAVEETSETAALAAAQQSRLVQAGSAAANRCQGAIWIGQEGGSNLRREDGEAVQPSQVAAGERYAVTRTLVLRSGLPDEATYRSQDNIGVVALDSVVEARDTARRFRRPTGDQYWLEVRVPAQACSVVYFQFTGASRARAQEVAQRLGERGYTVPGQEQLSTAQRLREIRYYYEADRPLAEQLASDVEQVLRASGGPGGAVTPRFMANWPANRRPPRGTLELWIDLGG